MTISMILGWLGVLLTVLIVFKYIARISGNKKLNKLFHKIHIPLGILLLIVSVLHGLIAGNMRGSDLATMKFAPVLFTWNYGTALLVVGVVLTLTYIFRKKLPIWMEWHRIFTVVFIVCLALHLYEVGIQLPGRILGDNNYYETSAEVNTESGNSSEDAADSSAGNDESSSVDAEASEQDETKSEFSGAVLQDGTYEGSAEGFRGNITVEVSVENGAVTSVEVVDQMEDQQFFQQALGVLDSITNSQSLEVDSVSGATFSSAGLINAVYDALQPAVESGTLNVNEIDLSNIPRHH